MSLNILLRPFGLDLRPYELSESYYKAAFRFYYSYIYAASVSFAPYRLLFFTYLLRTDIGSDSLPEII